jgi:hypothetical protein
VPPERPRTFRAEHDPSRLNHARHNITKNITCMAEEAALRDAENESAHIERQLALRPPQSSRPPSQSARHPRLDPNAALDQLLAQAERLLR